jgi:hypothetical protein
MRTLIVLRGGAALLAAFRLLGYWLPDQGSNLGPADNSPSLHT